MEQMLLFRKKITIKKQTNYGKDTSLRSKKLDVKEKNYVNNQNECCVTY